jgi:alginate O-acetyltransferase complex protein AlgI
MICDKLFWLDASKRLPRIVNVMLTFALVMLGWVIFRAKSLPQMSGIFQAMLSPGRDGAVLGMTGNVWLALGVAAALSFLPCCGWYETIRDAWRGWRPSLLAENWALSVLALFALSKAVTVTFNPFLYFRF